MTAADREAWQRMVLRETLALAVPLHMAELRSLDPDEITVIANGCARVVGEKGDVLQFKGHKGGATQAFNALAKGLACAALTAWGGVTFQGLHWCVVPGCTDPDGDHPQPAEPAPVPATFRPSLNSRTVTDLPLPDHDTTEAA